MGSRRQFCSEFVSHSSKNFLHTSGSTELITLIWVSLEISIPSAEFENRCHLWLKVTRSDEKQRPTIITTSYGQQSPKNVLFAPSKTNKIILDNSYLAIFSLAVQWLISGTGLVVIPFRLLTLIIRSDF